jgi:hypothetical protein
VPLPSSSPHQQHPEFIFSGRREVERRRRKEIVGEGEEKNLEGEGRLLGLKPANRTFS